MSKDNDVSKVLKERGEVYGSYESGTKFRASVMLLIQDRYRETHKVDMAMTEFTMIWDIVNKLSRLSVSPLHLDTWKDIEGYARLSHDAIEGKKEVDDKIDKSFYTNPVPAFGESDAY